MAKPKLPLQMIHDNLIAARDLNDVWAVFRVRSRSYRAEPRRRQASLVYELETFARVVEADFQVLRVSRRFDADEYVRALRERTPHGAHRNLWNRYLEQQRSTLEHLEAWTPHVFVCVRLAEPSLDLHGHASRLFERTPREILRDARNRAKITVHGSLYVPAVVERERVARARITSCLDATPATTEEIQWLIRRAFCRGVAEPTMAPEDASDKGSSRALIRWFNEHGVEHRHRHLRSIGDYGESYQAGHCLGEMGHAPAFSRQVELMFTALEEHPWPIDAALNVRYLPNDQALRRAEHQVARTANQLEDEEYTAHGARGEAHRRAELADELHDRLSDTGEPILEGTLSFFTSAGTIEELHRRLRALREGFPWPLYRPYGDQLELWKQHLPAQPSLVRGFERPFTAEQIGAMVPHGTHDAGSTGGRSLYIARSLHGRQPVLFDLREGSGTDKAPTVALLGSLGGGKTMFLQLLLYQAFLQGARIVDVDPKGDHRFHELVEVAPHTQSIQLGPQPEHAGKLDPLRVAPANERHDAAATFLIDVLPPVDAGIHAAISGAITRVLDRYKQRACCMAVVDELEAGSREEELRAGYLLRQYCEAGLVRLGFARVADPLPSRAAEQVTYLQIRALKRADVETVRSEMSQSQRHGRAILQLVALYAMRILGEERDRLKVLSFDEASFLAQDAVGQQLLDTLARWGRSELAVPILSTQLLGDVADQDNLIGHWFLFSMRSREHAVRALEALELDTSGPLVDALTERYSRGRALYRDLRGQCEEVQIDMGRSGLLEALSTTPVEREPVPGEAEPLVRVARG